MRARRMARTTEAADEREEAEAHTQENGGEGSTRVEAGLAESEEREIEERVKGLYEGLVRGLKRVLLEEVARRATEEYYETQKKAQETEEHTSEGAEEADAREVEGSRDKQGGKGAHEHTQQG